MKFNLETTKAISSNHIDRLFTKYDSPTQYLIASAKFDKHQNIYLFLKLYVKTTRRDFVAFNYSDNINFHRSRYNVHQLINDEINYYEDIALSLNLNLILENHVMDVYDYYKALNDCPIPADIPLIEE